MIVKIKGDDKATRKLLPNAKCGRSRRWWDGIFAMQCARAWPRPSLPPPAPADWQTASHIVVVINVSVEAAAVEYDVIDVHGHGGTGGG